MSDLRRTFDGIRQRLGLMPLADLVPLDTFDTTAARVVTMAEYPFMPTGLDHEPVLDSTSEAKIGFYEVIFERTADGWRREGKTQNE